MSSSIRSGSPLEVAPGPVDIVIGVPGSKSVSNRALVCASLANGRSTLRNIAPGVDTSAMLDGLRVLGVKLSSSGTTVEIEGSSGIIRGGGTVEAQLAGTTSRFLTAMSALGSEPTIVTGDEALRRRPMGDLHRALRDLGADVQSIDVHGHLPVRVSRANLAGGRVSLRGNVSSQFLSALMLIGPCLEDGLTIALSTDLVSRPYVEMTAWIQRRFGIAEVDVSERTVRIPQGIYRCQDFVVEPDASSASYPLAAAAITVGRVEVEGLTRESTQGDIRILDILEQMGCSVDETEKSCIVTGTNDLTGVDIDMSDISDLVPTVAAVALFASTPTRIRNIGFIRSKESDRIGDLISGIEAIGGRAHEFDDGMEIFPLGAVPARSVQPATCHDHRLAMVWSLIALRRPGISIDEPEVVDKSWPQWWDVRENIRSSSLR